MKLHKPPLLIVDTRLLMYYLHHRKGNVQTVTHLVAEKYSSVLSTKPKKIIFAMDKGESFRKTIYKDYKAHRRERDKKLSHSEKLRLNAFNSLYKKIPPFLENFGNVLQVSSIEADDIASAISLGVNTDKTPIVFLTSDEDWVKFMKEGVYFAHVNREELYSYQDIETVFGYKPDWKLYIDCITGVSKENVPGIANFGKNRAIKVFESVDGNVDYFLEEVEKLLKAGKYGMKLPEQFSSVFELYEFNRVLFAPVGFVDLHNDVVKKLKEQYSKQPEKTVPSIIQSSLDVLETIYYPSEKEIFFYNLKDN